MKSSAHAQPNDMLLSYGLHVSVHYKLETLLPYSIRLPQGKRYRAAYDGLDLEFSHLSRVETPRTSGARMSPHLEFPADKYGLFFRSRVALILPESAIQTLMSGESDALRRVFPHSEEYVAHLFGSPAANLTTSVITVLNRMLSAYRVIYQDWHAAPVASMDLPSWRVLKVQGGVERFLTALELPNQIAQGSPPTDQGREEFFSKSLRAGAAASPLPMLEADIHDRVSHGDLLVGLVLMGLLVEEGIRDHLTAYIRLQEGILEEEAESRLLRANGLAYGIADMVDPPSGRRKTCLIESIAGWKPYEHGQYKDWNSFVREMRNEIIHRGRNNVNPVDAERAWVASTRFLELSFSQFLERLVEQGIQVKPEQVQMFRARSSIAGTPGLIGAFNRT